MPYVRHGNGEIIMNCSKCNMPLGDGDKFCQYCGTPVQEATNDVNFCENCGRKLEQNETVCPVCTAQVTNFDSVQQNDYTEADRTAYTAADNANNYASGGDVYGNGGMPDYGNNYGGYNQNKSSGGKGIYIVLIVLLSVLILGGIGFLAFMFMSDGGGNTGNDAVITTVTAPPQPTAAPTQVPAPVFARVDASSTRGTDSEGGQYSKEAVMSNDPMTKWVPSKNSGNGIGQWIQLSADSTQYVKGVKILNGYHKNSTTWSKNNRVSLCSISFSNGESKDFTLPDTMDMITLDFGTPVATTFVRITIKSVYYGSRWNDTAITYFSAY